jgi:hypothetical protein
MFILSHKQPAKTLACLSTWLKEEDISFKILVLDNGSQYDTADCPNGRTIVGAKRTTREAVFGYPSTSMQDMVRLTGDLHELTRFWQKDVDGDRFMQVLHTWLNHN